MTLLYVKATFPQYFAAQKIRNKNDSSSKMQRSAAFIMQLRAS